MKRVESGGGKVYDVLESCPKMPRMSFGFAVRGAHGNQPFQKFVRRGQPVAALLIATGTAVLRIISSKVLRSYIIYVTAVSCCCLSPSARSVPVLFCAQQCSSTFCEFHHIIAF